MVGSTAVKFFQLPLSYRAGYTVNFQVVVFLEGADSSLCDWANDAVHGSARIPKVVEPRLDATHLIHGIQMTEQKFPGSADGSLVIVPYGKHSLFRLRRNLDL